MHLAVAARVRATHLFCCPKYTFWNKRSLVLCGSISLHHGEFFTNGVLACLLLLYPITEGFISNLFGWGFWCQWHVFGMWQSPLNKGILSLQFAIQDLCCLARINCYSHQEELSFWFCFCISEIAGFLARLTACSIGFRGLWWVLGLCSALLMGAQQDQALTITWIHVPEVSVLLTAFEDGFLCATLHHMRREGKNSIFLGDVPSPALPALCGCNCQLQGCVRSTGSPPEHWRIW